MGLHVAGLGGQNISVMNAVRWEEFVSVRQTDCGVELDDGVLQCEKGAEVLVQTLQDGVEQKARCGMQTRMCVTNDHVVSSIAVQAYASGNRSLAAHKSANGPVQRTSAQPFAVAGDVMLTVVAGGETGSEVVVSRLYDGGRGQFGVAEELTLLRNNRRVGVVTCRTKDDVECISKASVAGRIVMPVSYFEYESGQIPAASSQWAVHWAINPDLAVKSVIYQCCNTGRCDTSVIVESSWSAARVWSMKTVRAADMYGEEGGGGGVSYMVVPGFQKAAEFQCDAMASLQVVALEYINKMNVLATVLEGRARDVDPSTGEVCGSCIKRYRYYFINPERNDCVEPSEGPGSHFSCWKEGEQWKDDEETVLFGRTCPAADRMPMLGSAVAEATTVVVWMLRLLGDTLCVIPAAIAGGGWAGLAEVMQPRLGRQTFHSMVDTSGANFLNVEEIIRSMNRAALHSANSLVRVADAFAGRPGGEMLKHVMSGTAKILQHSDGLVLLGDPISRQLEAIRKLPSMQALAGVGESTTSAAMPLPMGLPTQTRLFVTFSSVLSLNLRIARRVLVRLTRATDVGGAVVGVLLAAVYESADDFDSFLESSRMQCQGLGEILGGTNPWARVMRQACQLGPDGVHFVLQAMRVMFVEYPAMACTCRLGEGERMLQDSAIVSRICLKRFSPAEQQRWMLQLVFTAENGERRDMCFASMDGANGRLLSAMDPFLSRVYRIAESAAEGLEYLISWFSVDRTGCGSYLLSPYVLSLVPEPADYFMSCMHTPDCRVKCLAEYRAFDEALERAKGGGPLPTFEHSTTIEVQSNLFDPYDAEENRHLPPFEIFAVLELGEACPHVCEGRVLGRCIAVAGRLDGGGVGLGYYCLPADVTMYVFEYVSAAPAFQLATMNVVDMMVLTGYKVALGKREWVLVLEQEGSYTVAVLAVPGMAFRTELFRSAEEGSDLRYGFLQSVAAVRVVPAMQRGGQARVFVVGKRRGVDADGGISWSERCLDMSINVQETDGSLDAMNVEVGECRSMSVLNSGQRNVCLNVACSRELVLPSSLDSPSEVLIRHWHEEWYDFTTSDDERFEISGKAATVARTLGADVVRPLYQLQSRAVRRRTVVSPMTLVSSAATFELIVCNAAGGKGREGAWINIVHLDLNGNKVRAFSSRTTTTQHKVNFELECSIDSCVGCASSLFPDLQPKCYSAQECGVARCAGTMVNMRKPLCSLGQIAAQHLHLFRISLGGLWQAIAQQVVMFVELSESRRKIYEVAWPEESFVALTCQAKDTSVQLSATFTSIVGAIGFAKQKQTENDVSMRSAAVDSRVHARFIMTLTALTNVLSSIMLLPVYALISVRKVLSCSANDAVAIFSNVFGSGQNAVTLYLGSKRLTDAAVSTVGVCLGAHEKEMLRDLASTKKTLAAGMQDLISGIAQLTVRTFLEYSRVFFDATVSWLIGVVSAMQDLVSTVDWQSCRLPDVTTQNVGQCACGDASFRIPLSRRQERAESGALWCSGLLLLTAVDGSDILVWNDFSLEQLLAFPGLDAFMACLSNPVSGRCSAPEVSQFRQQGVELMQVISRCRSNYQRSKWDDAAVLYSLFEPVEWARGRLVDSALDDQYTKLRLRMQALSRNFDTRVNIDDATWSCLRNALESSDPNNLCHEIFVGRRERHFLYERSAGQAFADTDACQVFSGASPGKSDFGATFTPYVWSADSRNKVPVGLLHDMEESRETRLASARQQLGALVREIRELFGRISPEKLQDDLKVQAFSVEGDQLHQLVDCVVIGPYAAAEIPIGYVSSNGARTVASMYHRGDADSRMFQSQGEGGTGGSAPRKAIIAAAVAHIDKEALPVVAAAARNNIERLRAVFLGSDPSTDIPRNLMCRCANGGASLECCAEYDDRGDISFGAKDFFDASLLNLQSSVLHGLLDNLASSSLLNVSIWTDDAFAPPAEPIPEADRDTMHARQLFNYSYGAYRYDRDEVRSHIGGQTLWVDCMQQLSSAFFTLPMRFGGGVDADLEYDPMDGGTGEYLHVVESVVARVLRRAYLDSPVYWSHPNRYVPSDSVWCEDTSPPTPPPVSARALHPDTFGGEDIEEDTVMAPSLAQTVFPASVGAHCFCGWHADGRCMVTQAACLVGSDGPDAATWASICQLRRYSTREELFVVVRALEASPLEAPWRRECSYAKPSTLWGLLDAEQTREWFAGRDAEWAVDLHTLATAGPGGLRLAHFGNQAPDKPSGEDSLWEYARTNATGAAALNTKLNHSVGQPVCRSTLELSKNLSTYFRDVFFPMAHSVYEAPSRAACSRWVVEYAVQMAMTQIDGGVGGDAVQAQTSTAEVWRGRCEAQLQQVGACELRGAFDIYPPSAVEAPATCQLSKIDSSKCDPFFFTPNCLLRCGADFFDPCACGTDDCAFVAGKCDAGRLRVRGFADSAEVRLLSMIWPKVVGDAEGASSEIEEALRAMAAEKESVLDFPSLYKSFAAVLAGEEDGAEGEAPRDPGGGYCEDLLDYWDGSLQHPVGYHPTMACSDAESNVRGFDSWMSADEEGRISVDPQRMRDHSLSSTVFGAASMVCDASVYGADGVFFNDLYLNSRWNPLSRADPAVPIQTEGWHESQSDEIGMPSRDPADTPLLDPTDTQLPHSVGLVRDWLSGGSEETWPHWAADWDVNSSAFPDAFGSPLTEPVCAPPLIRQCRSNDECASPSGDLRCMRQGVATGVCMREGTCFQHAHCEAGLMCSGNGECVSPSLSVHNSLGVDAALQIHSRACVNDSPSSHFQHVANFAQAGGMCKFRNWFHQRQLQTRSGVLEDNPTLLFDSETWVNLTDRETDMRIRDWLRLDPHVCDRSYQVQQGFGLCRGSEIPATVARTGETATPYPVFSLQQRYQDNTYTRMCDTRFLQGVSGFLDPYRNYVDSEDNLLWVPSTIRRCWEFKICPKSHLRVQGEQVQRRTLLTAAVTDAGSVELSSTVRDHCAYDVEKCWGVGYLVGSSCSEAVVAKEDRCTVDVLVFPVLLVVFGVEGSVPEKSAYVPALITRDKLQARLGHLQAHCPSAFADVSDVAPISRMAAFYDGLVGVYPSTMKELVTELANTLLLSVFGVSDVTAGEMRTATDSARFEAHYFASASCVAYVLQEMETLHEAFRGTYKFEARETGIKPLSPGSSLYLFMERQPVYVPFTWMWQCAVLGGAEKFWLRTVAAGGGPECAVFGRQRSVGNVQDENFMSSIKERMLGDHTVYTRGRVSSVFAEQVIEDLDTLINMAVVELGIQSRGTCSVAALITEVRRFLLTGQEEWTLQWYDYTVQDFVAKKILLERSLDDSVGAHDNEFPFLTFARLRMDFAEEFSEWVQGGDGPACFAHGPIECATFFAEETDCNILLTRMDSLFKNVDELLTTVKTANYVLLFIERNMHQMPSFAGREFNIISDHPTSHRLRLFSYSGASEKWMQQRWLEAASYNRFMQTKGFECVDDYDSKQSTNVLHQRMSKCVDSMQDTGGWIVDNLGGVSVAVTRDLLEQGFYPSFLQSSIDDRWLTELFSDDVAMRNSESNSICYVTETGPKTMNPFWAGDFDIETGCDTSLAGATRFIDVACRPREGADSDMNCVSQFMSYENTVKLKIPATCRERNREILLRLNMGSLEDGETPLCERKPPEEALCTRKHGTLHGYKGEDIESMHQRTEIPQDLRGVWSASNEVMRGGQTTASGTLALSVLPTDIAGHSMAFRMSGDRGLRLECLGLASEHSSSCARTVTGWLAQVEAEWERQHVFLRENWKSMARRGVGWHCPLQWVTAYAGLSRSYSASSPSRERNMVRFSHLTGASSYAHPTVSSVDPVLGLRPARFMSDFRACVAVHSAQCRGAAHLQQTVRDLRVFRTWREVSYVQGGDACVRVLDWPHEAHTLRDRGVRSEGGEGGPCNVYERMPRFALSLERGSLRVGPSVASSVGGACHMGRLRRVKGEGGRGRIQRCRVQDSTLKCSTLKPDGRVGEDDFDILPEHTPSHAKRARGRRCATCLSGRARRFVRVDGESEDMLASRAMLSTGEQARLSPERVIASHIRRHVCGATLDCPRLQSVFNLSKWRRGQLLPALLDGPQAVRETWVPPEPAGGAGRAGHVEQVMWQRPWVFCVNGSAACSGSILRDVWLDPAARVQACNAAVKLNTPPSEARVVFCLLNSDTEELCRKSVEWRDKVQTILCQVAGTCPVSTFFYSPTAYDLNNQEFVHDTVQAYYTGLGMTCPEPTTQQVDQIESNNRLKDRCAANSLERVRTLLHGLRGISNLIMRIFYYTVSCYVYILNIFVSAVTAQVDLLKQNAELLVRYCLLLLDAIADVFEELFAAFAQLIFGGGRMEAILELIVTLCEGAEWLHREVLQAFVCDVLIKYFAKFLNELANFIESFKWIGGDGAVKAAQKIRDFANKMLNIDFCTVEIDYNCRDLLPEEEEVSPGTLPTSTRCWSTYVTFFGDTQQLSCTQADTCKRSLTDNSLVVCGACGAAGSGHKSFGCHSLTKQCTCDVPALSRTLCYSNAECRPSASCQYIDDELEPAAGFVECSACQSRAYCLIREHASAGVCACGLFDMPYAQCSVKEQGELMSPPFALPCIFQQDQKFARGRSFEVSYSESMTIPCQVLTTAYCMRVVDIGGDAEDAFWLVGVRTPGRRLLWKGDVPHQASRSPMCRDAELLNMVNTVRACREACARSEVTVKALGLGDTVSGCAFASIEDMVHVLRTQPMVAASILARPQAWPGMLLRHSPLHSLHHVQKAATRALGLLEHMARLDNISHVLTFNRSSSGTVRVRSTNPRLVPGAVAEALQFACNAVEMLMRATEAGAAGGAAGGGRGGSRRLLFSEVVASVERALAELDSLRESYSTQIADVFSYRYADVDTEATRAAWLYDMGPDSPAAALRRNPCQLFTDILQLFKTCFGGLEKALRDRSLQSTPAATLSEAWRVSMPPSADDPPPPPSNSFAAAVVNGIVASFKAVGVPPSTVYAVIQAFVREAENSLSCDYLAVQTCSKWRVRLLHGCIVVTVWFAAWFVLCGTLNLGFVSALTLPAFALVLMSLCYGYALSCAPMVPVCFFEDFLFAVRTVMPRQMAVPDSLLRNSVECQKGAASPTVNCIRSCADAPLSFTSWYSPAAWIASEVGLVDVSWLRWVPLIDRDSLELEVRLRASVVEDTDEDLKTANRLCTLFSAHLLIPYLIIAFLAIVFTSALFRSLAAILSSSILTISMLFASASTED